MSWKKAKNNKKVFVGLSGGVDSSVSALLLKQAGYEVVGVFIKVWQPDGGDCTWKEDRRDAMRVAAHLGIKFRTLDLRDEYKKGVVDYMISEYAKGRTPNPDVMCNKEVKFGGFMKWAIDQGADYVATGHYAITNNGELYEGRDVQKDQSYFLWTLSGSQLEKILFPIGHLNKSEVRILAEKNNIPVAKKKDSQGVCFIGHINMKDFVREQLALNPKAFGGTENALTNGDILDISGNVIGVHDGSLLYTMGERHGFNLFNNKTDSPRYYVIGKDINKNTITIAEKKQIENDGFGALDKINLSNVNFISNSYKEILKAKGVINCLARARYRQEKFKCKICFIDDKTVSDESNIFEVKFEKAQSGIAPGQSLVLYFDEQASVCATAKTGSQKTTAGGARVLGGAII